MGLPVIEYRAAQISPDGKYRYSLERQWSGATDQSPAVVWCMLNPSTADASVDDPTIRRCIGFTDSWGWRRLIVVNLYAYRATDPRDLEGLTLDELYGPHNMDALRLWTLHACTTRVVCAWGGKRFKCLGLPQPIKDVWRCCLGLTATGEPKHPLYLPASTPLQSMP